MSAPQRVGEGCALQAIRIWDTTIGFLVSTIRPRPDGEPAIVLTAPGALALACVTHGFEYSHAEAIVREYHQPGPAPGGPERLAAAILRVN